MLNATYLFLLRSRHEKQPGSGAVNSSMLTALPGFAIGLKYASLDKKGDNREIADSFRYQEVDPKRVLHEKLIIPHKARVGAVARWHCGDHKESANTPALFD